MKLFLWNTKHAIFRKRSVLACAFLFVVSAVFFFFCRMANSVPMLILGRLIVGVAAGLTTSTLPMYTAELSPIQLRGTVAVLSPMGLIFGVAVGQIGVDSKMLFSFSNL